MKPDGFLLSTVGAIALASLFPSLGSSHGALHAGALTNIGIALVFFLHGTELSTSALRAGAANCRPHLYLQLSTYLLFPLLGLVLFVAARRLLSPEVRLGMFYLRALPSTISSAVSMTSIGKGNVAGAVFDATLSGLIGMALTPVLVGLVSATEMRPLPILPAIQDVANKLLLPFAAGQLLRPVIHASLHRHQQIPRYADRGVIVRIVYVAFCDSTLGGIWSRYSPADIARDPRQALRATLRAAWGAGGGRLKRARERGAQCAAAGAAGSSTSPRTWKPPSHRSWGTQFVL